VALKPVDKKLVDALQEDLVKVKDEGDDIDFQSITVTRVVVLVEAKIMAESEVREVFVSRSMDALDGEPLPPCIMEGMLHHELMHQTFRLGWQTRTTDS